VDDNPDMVRRLARASPSVAAVLGLALAALFVGDAGLRDALGRAAGAAVLLGAWRTLRRDTAEHRADSASPRPWFARAALATAVGGALAASFDVASVWFPHLADLTAPVFSFSSLVGSMLAYQGVVRWNRYRVGVVAPEDWVNGTATVLAATAALLTLAPGSLESVASILRAAELGGGMLVVGTMAAVAHLAGLRRDPRFWACLATFTAILACQALGLARPDLAGLSSIAWAGAGAAAVLLERHAPLRARSQRHPASARATAFGSITVLLASVAVVGGEHTATLIRSQFGLNVIPSICASVAAAAAILRLAALVRDHSLLAVSRQEARTDELTGLGNRRALLERLDEGIGRVGVSLILVDLDAFKDVNDRHGHPAGDQLLRVVGDCLRAATPPDGLAARIGGDEFALVVGGGEPEATAVAASIQSCLASTRLPAAPTARVGASVGIAVGGIGPEDLMWRADVALYEGKRSGGRVVVYDDRLGAAAHDRRRLTDELRGALAGEHPGLDQFVVWFQPQLDALRDTPTAVEALVRWEHPERGLLGPGAFLDAVAAEDLMPVLTEHVLRTACRVASGWIQDGAISRVAVNVAPCVLSEPDLVNLVADALRSAGLTPANLVLEVTESAVIADDSPALDNAAALAERGVALSIDDYGTGYSSLTRLHHLPVDEIKLDRDFTRDLQTDARAQIIVTATIDLAHRLGQRVIAEGVEDLTTLRFLAEVGCDEIQGWVHAPAMTADEMTAWLGARRQARERVPAPHRP
jgi:diguanylate cyclase (GGDEF)-like protein